MTNVAQPSIGQEREGNFPQACGTPYEPTPCLHSPCRSRAPGATAGAAKMVVATTSAKLAQAVRASFRVMDVVMGGFMSTLPPPVVCRTMLAGELSRSCQGDARYGAERKKRSARMRAPGKFRSSSYRCRPTDTLRTRTHFARTGRPCVARRRCRQSQVRCLTRTRV